MALVGGATAPAAQRSGAAAGEAPLRPTAKLREGAEGGEAESRAEVALSANGQVALVGAPDDAGGVGSASVFVHSGSGWIQQGPALSGAGETGLGEFGGSVALSASGGIALVGGYSDGAPAQGRCCARGAVWVFTRSGSTWTQDGAPLTGISTDGTAEFGYSLALSPDGSTALVGAPRAEHTGIAWVFTHTPSGWRGAELRARGATPDAFFGSSVALSADGDMALVGADGNEGGGAVWVFARRHDRWLSEGARLRGKEDSGFAHFGTAVALSGKGSTALVGAGGEDGEKGAAWIFTRSGPAWRRRAKLTARPERGLGNFGESVALSWNGRIALVGAPQEEGVQLARVGGAWLFTGAGSSWRAETRLAAPAGSGEDGLFGATAALSAAGTTGLVGVEVDDNGPGAAWVLSG